MCERNSDSPELLEMILTADDIEGLREAIAEGIRQRTNIILYRGVGMDHRPAHHVLEALESGQEEVRIGYAPWQIVGRDPREPG